MVTVPGRLHRVVYIVLQASSGYRGCIPWWRRSHHPESPSSHTGRKRTETLILFLLFPQPTLSPSLPLLPFFHSCKMTLAAGTNFPQLVAVSLRSALARCTLPTFLLQLKASLPPSLSLSSLLLSFWSLLPNRCYVHPFMFIKQLLIDYS